MKDAKLPDSLLKAAEGLGPEVQVAPPTHPLRQATQAMGDLLFQGGKAIGLDHWTITFTALHVVLNSIATMKGEQAEALEEILDTARERIARYRQIKEAGHD